MQAKFDSILEDADLDIDVPSGTVVGAVPRRMFPAMPGIRADSQGPLRVLMVVESSGAGTGRHVLELSESLIERGCDVHLVYSNLRADDLFLSRLSGLSSLKTQVVLMRVSPHPSDLTAVWAVRRYLRRHGPFDVVHGHSSKGGAVARVAALGTGIPAVYTPHGLVMMDPDLSLWKRAVYQLVEIALSLRTGRIIAVSPEEQSVALGAGLGKSRVVMVPNGIGSIGPATRADARRAIGVADDHIVFGFVGRLVPQKAPEVAVEAFAILSRGHPQARLVVIGAGPLDADLRKLAFELGVEASVMWLGEREARTIMPAFDVFALPSRKEGLPYVVLEAMMAGLPVVATESAGVDTLVESGWNGAVVPRDDVPALAEAMIGLAADPEMRARYARASRQRVSRFTVEAMVERTLQVYHDSCTRV